MTSDSIFDLRKIERKFMIGFEIVIKCHTAKSQSNLYMFALVEVFI